MAITPCGALMVSAITSLFSLNIIPTLSSNELNLSNAVIMKELHFSGLVEGGCLDGENNTYFTFPIKLQ